jgi:long-chain fatty acid transport protein
MNTIARSVLPVMSNLTRRPFLLPLSTLALLSAAPRTAHATGFLTDQFGSDHGQPALSNAYSVYFNPAAMAGAAGSDITLGGVVAARSVNFNRSQSALSPSCLGKPNCTIATDPTYVSANTGSATLFNALAAPFAGFVTDFGGSSFRLGVASYVPFGGSVSWQKTQSILGAPGASDGPQRWASISTTTSSLYNTLAFAYRLEAAHLGIGVSVSAINSSAKDTRAHNLDGSDDVLTSNNTVAEGRSYLDVSGWQIGAALGLYWEATPTLRFGASYTSQPGFGTMRLSGTFKQWQQSSPELSSNVDLLQAFPDVVRIGGAWRVAPDAELRLDASYQRWSALKNQCVVNSGQQCNVNADGSLPAGSSGVLVNIPRNLQDAVKVRLGGAYWVQPETEIFGSGAVETSPVSSAYDDPLVFDSVRLYGTLGIRHAFTKHWYAGAAYTYVYFLPVTVTDSAYAGYSKPSRSPNENGSYNSQLYILDASVSYVF